MPKHTYNYGLLGNCAYLALVHQDTSIAWLCWPRFDSSFVLGSLLDQQKGGEFSVKPAEGEYDTTQQYIENTNIISTEVNSPDGSYRVTDFAPRFLHFERYYKPLMLIRKIEPLSGTPRIRVRCSPMGEYGEKKPNCSSGSNHISFFSSGDEIRLTTDVSLTHILEDEPFVLNEVKYLILTYGAPLEAPLQSTAEDFLKKTADYWRTWVKHTSIRAFAQQQVIRSSLALKLHQYEDTGGIIASPTTSLPESPGSGRNWDYRYCWLRDTYYILNALNNIGHFEEMERYFHYIANVTAKSVERYQPLYTISGGTSIVEKELPLEGYLGNKPVRVGNDAYTHIQNDSYGQVLVALLPLYVDRRFTAPERAESVRMIYDTLEKLEQTMHEPDAGLWEFRNFAQYHCYTYLFHWAGSKAALKVAEHLQNEEMAAKARELMEMAAGKIEECYDAERGVYTDAIGSANLDASTLQLIMMRYLDPGSERARQHLRVLESKLKTPEGLFYRYKHTDDFGEPESTFLICAFWYVEALACVGRVEEAVAEFNKLTKYGNHLGLLSEDIDAATGSQWGNFPQAYSHVGLMNAAYRITRKLDLPAFY